jgi:hypothetical protein
MEAYHLQRTRFELIAERKLRPRPLTDDGHVEVSRRELRAHYSEPLAANTDIRA